MTALALIFILSVAGISETAYIIRKRMAMEKPMCPIGGDCTVVLSSKYNKIFFIQNDTLGLLTYILILLLSIGIFVNIGLVDLYILLLKIIVVIASIFSLVLTYIEWRVIKTWCFWCLSSAVTIWIIGIILFLII